MPGAYDPARAQVPSGCRPYVPPLRRHVETFEPVGRPTPYSGGENTENWQKAVRASIADKRFTAPANGARLAVRIEFRLRLEHDSYEPDPDNLLKSTFDAMDGVLGLRKRKGKPEADDERIDYLEVLKRQAREDEEWGATIEVYALEEPEN